MPELDVRLAEQGFDPHAELARFTARYGDEGAVAAFIGVTRGEARDGPVTALLLEHYPGFTERSLEAIAWEGSERFALSAVLVVHRAGRTQPGDPIVLAAAAAAHRRPALDAVQFLMDRLKTDAAFWKREEGPTGSRWIEPTAADHAARRRWD